MKTIKTEQALSAYRMLSNAKYNMMEDSDKIKIFKITRAIKPIATAFDEAGKEAAEKMKFDGFDEQLRNAQLYEQAKKDNSEELPMTESDYKEFIKKLIEYNNLVKSTIKELGDKEETIDVELLNEDSLGKLMASNDWTMEQVMAISDIVCE